MLSTQNVSAPFDTTGYTSISGAQLKQLIDGINMYADKGLVLKTSDTGVTPDVPDAATNTEWQRCIWLRVSASSVSGYFWNPAVSSDPTYLKWRSFIEASIGVGTILTYMLADNSVTDVKIVSMDASKLTGSLPASILATLLTSSTAAGGDLTGTYPNPTIANDAVTEAKVLNGTLTNAKLEAGGAASGVNLVTKGRCNTVGYTVPRTNASATAIEWSTPAQQVVGAGAGDVGKTVIINTPYTDGLTLVQAQGSYLFGRVLQIVETGSITPDSNTTVTCAITALPTTTNTKAFAALDTAFTPKSAASTLLIEVTLQLSNTTAGNLVGALFVDAGTDAVAAGASHLATSNVIRQLTFRYKVASGSTTARTYKVGYSSSALNVFLNSTNGATTAFGGTLGIASTIRVTEYL